MAMTITQLLTLAATALISSSIYFPVARFVGVRLGDAVHIYRRNVYQLIAWFSLLFQGLLNIGIFLIVLGGVGSAKQYVDPIYLVILGIVMCVIAYNLMPKKRTRIL